MIIYRYTHVSTFVVTKLQIVATLLWSCCHNGVNPLAFVKRQPNKEIAGIPAMARHDFGITFTRSLGVRTSRLLAITISHYTKNIGTGEGNQYFTTCRFPKQRSAQKEDKISNHGCYRSRNRHVRTQFLQIWSIYR
jgi:hypothetical protein